jgi:uncharacterized protein (UPF0332 family)
MSILKEKSSFNITAAKLLNDNYLFAPSIHCSYYSCLQLMKVAVREFKGISLKEMEDEIIDAKNTKNLNSHSYIIKVICDLIHNDSKADHSLFERKITQLKKLRVNSDYEEVEITTSESSKAFEFANEIRAQISKTFHV